MGGDISVSRSHGDNGIMFSFFIPVKANIQPIPEAHLSITPSALSSRTILIAEDEKNNFMFLEEALRKTGLKIIWAMNGKEALEQVASNQGIDIILMDIKMPLMDGYTATREIKKIRPDVPVIAQTAYASSDEKARSLEAGCDAYLTKPIRPTYLIQTISQFFT
jgi:CheY-like chemotaxis protein